MVYGGRFLTGFFLSREGEDVSRDVATIHEKGIKRVTVYFEYGIIFDKETADLEA